MSIKKVFFGFAVVALLVGMSAVPVKADQISDLQAMIAQLTAQINALSGGTIPTSGGYTFTTNLTVGSRGADVTALHQILIDGGYLNIAAPTGYFGNLTKAAVMKWQTAEGLTPDGRVGPISRGVLNSMPGPGTTYVPPESSGPCTGGAFPSPVTGMCPTGAALPTGCQPGDVFSRTVVGLSCTAGAALPTGCQPGDAFSRTVVGLSCTVAAALPAGCLSATQVASYTTGMSCATVTPDGTTAGTEGSITTKLAASPAADTNIRRTTDVSVYGVEFEAVNSDMTVDRADLQFTVSTWGSTTAAGTLSAVNPGNFINTIKAWDGSTLLGSWSVGNTSFSKDSSDRYHIILSGLNSKVTKGTKKNITFSVSVNAIGSTDVPRRVAIQGYAGNTQNMRATDSVGLQSYTDMSGTANTRTHDFKAAGASTLTVSINTAATPKAANHKVSTTDGVLKLVMQAFDAKSESGDSKITKIYATVNATSTTGLPSTLYLCANNPCETNYLGSVTAATTDGGQSVFTSLSILVPQDTTKTFYFAADFPTTANGQQASTSIGTNYVQWEKPDGATASTTPSSEIAGNDHYFDSAVPQWTIATPGTISVTTPTYSGAASSTISGSLTFKVKAVGGALTKPVIADFGLGFASSTQTTYTDAQLLGVGESGFTAVIESIDPSDATVGDGNEYTIKVKATQLAGTAAGVVIIPAAANYKLVATSTKAVVGGNTITQTWNTATWESPFGFFTSN